MSPPETRFKSNTPHFLATCTHSTTAETLSKISVPVCALRRRGVFRAGRSLTSCQLGVRPRTGRWRGKMVQPTAGPVEVLDSAPSGEEHGSGHDRGLQSDNSGLVFSRAFALPSASHSVAEKPRQIWHLAGFPECLPCSFVYRGVYKVAMVWDVHRGHLRITESNRWLN